MTIHSFDELLAIDEDLTSLFLRPDEAVKWIYAVENGIKDWIGKHNKQYWEIVRYVSEQRGILGKLRKDGKTVRLIRNDFARVLLKFCPNAVEKGETIGALKSSMEHYQFAAIWKELDRMPDSHIVRPLIKTVEDLLDNVPIIEHDEKENKPTLEDLLAEYLRREVDEQSVRVLRSKVCIRPQYGDISPAISVETYKSEQFLKEHRPSHIEAYEFVDSVLKKSKLNELTGQYQGKQIIKLYIVSSFGLTPDVRALATDRGIGYVLLNPNTGMTSESYVLPRSIEDHAKQQYYLDILEGKKSMTSPLLILDGSILTSSLTDVLCDNGVAVKNQRLLNIPFLSEDDIEKIANALTKKEVDAKIRSLNDLNTDLSLDPFAYATMSGLNHREEVMEESQLGLLILGEPNCAILNSAGEGDPTKVFSTSNSKRRSMCSLSIQEIIGGMVTEYKRKFNVRKRFTMAHELGHHILHSPLFKEQGVESVGESEKTLLISKGDSRRLEYQANKFASFFLMPKDLVKTLYNIYYKQYYGGDPRPLYYDPEKRETWPGYDNIVGNMTQILQVSFHAMKIRLQSLGLLNSPN